MSALAGYSSLEFNLYIHSYPFVPNIRNYWRDFTRKKEQQNRYNAIMSSCVGAVS